ncbi:SO2930 family diheme c-type cytochrome [Fulvivirgaceae bacterium BMA10]|uniref:SO2930 family diheme c-type cytochrome n=1 Tax=Splendidivirga corallicola TaxID=3051826 RepID=A0ABT8KJC2_9BACT|nr:SO2930 family diheme c-type cytochrome [Fulvivirgaceae bacterium BMA10]
MKFRLLVLSLFSYVIFIGSITYENHHEDSNASSFKLKLSDYDFFEGNMANMNPRNGIVPYDLNTPLFSDYAEKLRFIKLPAGTSTDYQEKDVFEFPVGTILIKTFYYYKDFRNKAKGRQLMETRLLIHEDQGWTALPYIWNDEQTEAYLEVAGGNKNIAWINDKGKKKKLNYSIPNVNQCKGCHVRDQKIKPIGPTVRQLNGDFNYGKGDQNQLSHLAKIGWLRGLPDLAAVPKTAVWDDPSTGDLNQRARAWLDINCAHCHSERAPANTSGLLLNIEQEDPVALGILKTPVAAGRGSGGRKYDIVPGSPNESIFIYRLESKDPGIMMPELGRKMVHEEGVALIRDWIRSLD